MKQFLSLIIGFLMVGVIVSTGLISARHSKQIRSNLEASQPLRQLELFFFQPGGERLMRPITITLSIMNGQRGRQSFTSGSSKASVRDGRHLVSLGEGEPTIRLQIAGDGRSFSDTVTIFKVGQDLTVYPIFLAPVVDETPRGVGRFRPGTASIDERVSAGARSKFEAALVLAEQRRFGPALEEFTRSLLIEPRFPAAVNQIGLLFNQQGRIEEAVAAFTQAVTYNDKSINSYLNLGVSLNRLGRYGESIAVLSTLLETNPQVTRVRIPLAEALLQSQQWDAAVEMIVPALTDLASLPAELQSESRYILARAAFREERYRAAVRELTLALTSPGSWTNSPAAWLLLGMSHYELKQDREAEEALFKSLELGGRSMVEARYRLGQLFFRQNSLEKAARELELFLRDVEPGPNPMLMREVRTLQAKVRSTPTKTQAPQQQ